MITVLAYIGFAAAVINIWVLAGIGGALMREWDKKRSK